MPGRSCSTCPSTCGTTGRWNHCMHTAAFQCCSFVACVFAVALISPMTTCAVGLNIVGRSDVPITVGVHVDNVAKVADWVDVLTFQTSHRLQQPDPPTPHVRRALRFFVSHPCSALWCTCERCGHHLNRGLLLWRVYSRRTLALAPSTHSRQPTRSTGARWVSQAVAQDTAEGTASRASTLRVTAPM